MGDEEFAGVVLKVMRLYRGHSGMLLLHACDMVQNLNPFLIEGCNSWQSSAPAWA